MIAKVLPILAAAVSLAALSPAHAQSDYDDAHAPSVGEVVVVPPSGPYGGGREIKSQAVYFDDLDLNSPGGGYTLLMRIRSAARQVCQPAALMHGDLTDTADYQSCVRRAVSRAVRRVDAPSVQDAYYQLGVGTADLPAG
jgi:UrcA family protein